MYEKGYTSGVYDLFHIGHLNLLRNAKSQCRHLLVGVTTDLLCLQRKGHRPIICQEERIEIVRAIRYVDEAIYQTTMDKLDVVTAYKCDAVFVGSDWKGTPAWDQYEALFAQVGCTVVYLNHTEGISSSILRDKLRNTEFPIPPTCVPRSL